MKIKKKKVKSVRNVKPAAPQGPKKSQFKLVSDVCTPNMIAFHFWREWHRARARNDYGFMYEMSADESPFRAQLDPLEDFAEACRRRSSKIPGLHEGELRKISLAGPDVAYMFEVVGADDYNAQKHTVCRWYMLRAKTGWRVHDFHAIEVPKDEVDAMLNVAAFPEVTAPEGFEFQTSAD